MDGDTGRGGHVKMEVETGVILPHAKECLGLPEDKRDKEQILSHDPHKESGLLIDFGLLAPRTKGQ